MPKAKKVKCVECGDDFELEDYLDIGDTTFCPSCNTELKIIKIQPPQVEIAEAINDEDYNYDEEKINDTEDEF